MEQKAYLTMQILPEFPQWVVAAALCASLAGCSGGLKTDYSIAKERARSYAAEHPELDPKTRQAILRSRVHVGMTKDQVVAAWGRPIRIVRFRKGRQEEWTFGCDYPHSCIPVDGNHRRRLFDRYRHEAVVMEDGVVTYVRY